MQTLLSSCSICLKINGMDVKDIKGFLGQDWIATQDYIKSSLDSDISLLNSINSKMLSQSGKQMRPILSLMFARACAGQCVDASYRYAAAAELLHNATLLHDDVADKSETRRGKPTIMSLMGPSVSVLVGDFWLVKAVDVILRDSKQDVEAIKVFSRTISHLAEGEMLQLQKAKTGDTEESDYLRIIYSKTAALFEEACVTAALSVECSDEQLKAAKDYAVALGLAFQIKDDILDYAGTDSVGKPLGVDLLEQKITMPLLGALKNATSQEQERVRTMVKEIVEKPELKDEIVRFVMENGGLEYAAQRLNEYVEQAIRALDVLPDSIEKRYLIELAYYTIGRDK